MQKLVRNAAREVPESSRMTATEGVQATKGLDQKIRISTGGLGNLY